MGVVSAMRRKLQEYPLGRPPWNDDSAGELILLGARERSDRLTKCPPQRNVHVLAQQNGIADAEIAHKSHRPDLEKARPHKHNEAYVYEERQQHTQQRSTPLAGGGRHHGHAPRIPKSPDAEQERENRNPTFPAEVHHSLHVQGGQWFGEREGRRVFLHPTDPAMMLRMNVLPRRVGDQAEDRGNVPENVVQKTTVEEGSMTAAMHEHKPLEEQ
jgi:hypothetical protein